MVVNGVLKVNKSNLIVRLQSGGHANLDSFPFRYGFCAENDIEIELKEVRPIDKEKIHDSDKRYGVFATFKLPDSQKSLRGKFILFKNDDCICTVIREGLLFRTESVLSETLKTLREDKHIVTQDLFEMYRDKIRTHSEVVKFLSNKIGEKKVVKAESVAREKIENLANALKNSRVEVDQKNDEIDHLTDVAIVAEFEKEEALEEVLILKERLEKSRMKNKGLEFSMKNSIQSKEVIMSKSESFSGTDWSKETSTSGVFKCYEVQSPFLVVTLNTNEGVREIRCKNTHGVDYKKAIEDVKKLKDLDPIMYSTRGTGSFGGDWFYKIELDAE